jgi:glycosyltransferase involved in cell wall biosynthesis
LRQLAAGYTSLDVVGVGGFTLDITGRSYQVTATLCDRFGDSYVVGSNIPSDIYCEKDTPLFTSLLGANSSFRRQALEAIGGFDEVFAYFLDETDVCLRLIDRGGKIIYAPEALVYHRAAPNNLRTLAGTTKSRYMPARSKVYFILKHGSALENNPGDCDRVISKYLESERTSITWSYEQRCDISWKGRKKFDQEIHRAWLDAIRLAKMPPETNLALVKPAERSFRPYKDSSTRKLRIGLISSGFPPTNTDGIARWSHYVAKGLAKRGHRVHAITRTRDLPSVDFSEGFWVHRIRSEHDASTMKQVESWDLPSELVEWSASAHAELGRIGFDNLDVISAPIWDIEGIVPFLYAPVPVVTSLHTTYKLAEPFKPAWKDPFYKCHHVDKVVEAEVYLLKNCRRLLGNTAAFLDDLREHYSIDIPSSTIVVNHGVDDGIPMLPSLRNKTNGTKVLYVGRYESRKGFDTALAAAISICSSYPHINFRFLGAECNDSAADSVIALWKELPSPVKQRITLEGYVAEDVLAQAYGQCDIFLAPSRYESFGLVAIEAMRYGKPIVAGNVGGLKEVVLHNQTGLLVDPNDAGAIMKAVLSLCHDGRLIDRLGNAGKEDFAKRFSFDVFASNIEAAYYSFSGVHSSLP